jgi:hypothetical protein
MDRLEQLEERLAILLAQQQTLQGENNTLKETVNTLTAQQRERSQQPPGDHETVSTPPTIPREISIAPTAMTTTSSNGKGSEPKVASPEYYSGQRNKLVTFITQVTMVLTLQSNRFPTELSKIFYAGSFLRDTAFLWFQPYVTVVPKPTFMLDFDLFCQELRKTFGDPDEQSTAERQLYALKQRGSVSAYMADFMRYAVLIHWNDQAKAAQFYRGLKDSVKDELARIGKPHSLKDLQEAAIRIDSRLFERYVEKGEHAPTTDSSQTRFIPRTSTYTKTQTVIKPAENLRAINPDHMTRKGKLTPAEYQRRKDNNLCLYCGKKGHSVQNCPLSTKPRTTSTYQRQDSRSGKV